ncbi:DUF3500 domain-containing protein [Phycisphaeraceae bacterium D3-23]
MKRTLTLVAAGLVLAGCSHAPHATLYTNADTKAGDPIDFGPMLPHGAAARVAANALIESMSDEQRAATVLALDHDAHADWHFVPRRRRGLALGDMTDAQRHDLHKLLQSGLSDSGYLKAMDIVWLESILQELENRSDNYRDPGRYTLLLFGDPADPADSDSGGAWGWRFEGHHLSLNFTYTPDGIVTTPMFIGTNPAVVPSGLHAGKRILADEHNLAFAFIATLTDEQREAMMLRNAPRDIITGPGRETALREPAGIAVPELQQSQFDALMSLILVYTQRLERDKLDYSRLFGPDINSLHFAWAGSTNPEEPHYYRIYCEDQFVIEYATQGGGVGHVHTVFHDLTDPLAEDLLRRHFEQEHAGE